MAVAVKSSSLDSSRSDAVSGPRRQLDEEFRMPSAPIEFTNKLSFEEAPKVIGEQWAKPVLSKTFTESKFSQIQKFFLQGELYSSLRENESLGLSRIFDTLVSDSTSTSTDFVDLYSRLGRWRLKGTEELREAEEGLLMNKRNFRLLAIKALDEENIDTFNHACWLLSRKGFISARLLTEELLKRIGSRTRLSADQWINGLGALSSLNPRYLMLFAGSVRHILMSAAQVRNEDVLAAAEELALILPSDSMEERMTKLYILAKTEGAAGSVASRKNSNSFLAKDL